MSRKKQEIRTENVEQTQRIGRAIAQSAKVGWIVCLEGPMGAGKTAMSQGILQGLGVTGYITSPTFSLVHTYETKGIKIHHFDVFRLSGIEELWDIGFEDYLEDAVVVMEWASVVREELNGTIVDVTIEMGKKPHERIITVEAETELLEGLNLEKGWEQR